MPRRQKTAAKPTRGAADFNPFLATLASGGFNRLRELHLRHAFGFFDEKGFEALFKGHSKGALPALRVVSCLPPPVEMSNFHDGNEDFDNDDAAAVAAAHALSALHMWAAASAVELRVSFRQLERLASRASLPKPLRSSMAVTRTAMRQDPRVVFSERPVAFGVWFARLLQLPYA
jgi:hypothetical protein